MYLEFRLKIVGHLAFKDIVHKMYIKMIVFWDVAPCSLVEIDPRFRGAYCLHHQGDEWAVWTAVRTWNLTIYQGVIAQKVGTVRVSLLDVCTL
jgi:hypothetical protein